MFSLLRSFFSLAGDVEGVVIVSAVMVGNAAIREESIEIRQCMLAITL